MGTDTKTYCGSGTVMGHGDNAVCGQRYYNEIYQCGFCHAKDAKAKLAEMSKNREYTGTPEEVGAQLAADALGPTINEAMATHNGSDIVRMMSGMVAFMAGAVAENFGAEAAESMLRGTADKVAANAAQLQGKVN